MSSIPLEKYPGLPPLFLDLARGRSRLYPDPPTVDAAVVRGRELLARSDAPRLTASAFRYRAPSGRDAAEALASGRAVAVLAGHQIGIFTGPLYTLVKALDAVAYARELSRRGVPAVPVFWALADDHDLQEIARTAKPGPDGPETFVLEGADRSNRSPVGMLRIPEGIEKIVQAFRANAKGPEAGAIVEVFAARYAPGRSYEEAFVETMFDLVEEHPLLVIDPLGEEVLEAARRLFLAAADSRAEIADALSRGTEAVTAAGREPPVPYRSDLIPFFTIEDGVRRRVPANDVDDARKRVESGEARVSADVLTRPVLKSLVLPAALSVLGPSEIAYHSQSLPLFPIFGAVPPVLIPRTLLVLRGPAERRAQEALGIADEDLLTPGAVKGAATRVPQAEEVEKVARRLDHELSSLGPSVAELDPSLAGALETARRKATYQLEQLAERVRKAAERKDEVALQRRKRLETMILPGGDAAERVYPPLVFLLAWGRTVLDTLEAAAGHGVGDVPIVDVETAAGAGVQKISAG
ncbi:MAG TPA: bacillithiol biosynthesis BshC [Thermoanaerobaculia bacterium]|jgi:bacillithiol biosynthesis cysteine-adding enzyme BshC|nr:bacillithiol biosynthesis BshC [Thermoanaerobaculia bacterium]